MSRFIKLTNHIVNTAYITHVTMDAQKQMYRLHLAPVHHTGFMLFSSGFIDTNQTVVEAFKDKHPESYKAIEDWINHMPM